MKDKRILVKRWEVTHPDTLVGKLGFIEEAYIMQITRGGVGSRIKSIPIYTVGCRFTYEE